jgi:hypothetical protein
LGCGFVLLTNPHNKVSSPAFRSLLATNVSRFTKKVDAVALTFVKSYCKVVLSLAISGEALPGKMIRAADITAYSGDVFMAKVMDVRRMG